MRREPCVTGSTRSDIELEDVAVTPLADVRRLLRYRGGERDRGTPQFADGEVRFRR
jgi:hypothetical protein